MTVVVGMSGGVDSAAAALLLKREGRDVRGIFMRNWDDGDGFCPAREDLAAAAAAADVIGIDLDVVDLSDAYRERVFADFLEEYRRGRTPNPDVWCNAEIKFSAFLEHAMAEGAQALATGHYARIRRIGGGAPTLVKAEDTIKDQTYFLHRLTRDQLEKCEFPIGGLIKREVRELAREAGLANWSRRDSTGICFIGERPFAEFMKSHLPPKPGEIVTPEGEVIGEHEGVHLYTVGQRKGLRIGGRGDAWFVAEKDAAGNRLVAVQGKDHRLLLKGAVSIDSTSWISGEPPRANWVYSAKIRHRQEPAACTLTDVGDGTAEIAFAQPVWAAAPGQFAVLYDGQTCLGGGVIRSAT